MSALTRIVEANRAGEARGIPSYCTAHPETLKAIFAAYRAGDAPILIEATCNQVNQFGGYTGMTPASFRSFVEGLAQEEGIDPARLILGGDHLGPNPWKGEPAASAMAKARDLVAAYVGAGFTKIHLDASMPLGDDGALEEAEMAGRAADLCAVAERAGGGALRYVIGTEVPAPGGETEAPHEIAVTTPEAAARTFALHAEAFRARGLEGTLRRVLALVVQPGVDFGNDHVFRFAPEKARALSGAALRLPGIAWEAHSTDHQSQTALAALVRGHFAILKVGPELTFAFRQAVVGMALVEREMGLARPSGLIDAIASEMKAEPRHWRAYVPAGPREAHAMLFGLSDRVRYYWPRPAIQAALGRLYQNIISARPEPGLLAQFTGLAPDAAGSSGDVPRRIIQASVGAVVSKYRRAAGETP